MRCFLYSILLSSIYLFAQNSNPWNAKELNKAKRMMEYQKKLSDKSKVIVTGNIVDDVGNPLDDVQVEYVYSKPVGFKNVYFRKKIKSSRTFSMEQEGYTNLILYFQKEDYVSEKRFYTTQRMNTSNKNDLVLRINEKIVMQKIGISAKIKKGVSFDL